jgi:hypothetical protein
MKTPRKENGRGREDLGLKIMPEIESNLIILKKD